MRRAYERYGNKNKKPALKERQEKTDNADQKEEESESDTKEISNWMHKIIAFLVSLYSAVLNILARQGILFADAKALMIARFSQFY